MFLSSSRSGYGVGGRGGPRAACLLPLLLTTLAVLTLLTPAAARSPRRSAAPRDTTGVRSETVTIDGNGIRVTTDSRSGGDTILVGSHDGNDVNINIGRHGVVRIDDEHNRGDRVEMGDDVEVDKDEVVRGDAVSIGGDVIVRGRVLGDAVAVGGNIVLDDSATVGGDAVSVGGSVDKAKTAHVGGQAVQIGVSMPGLFFPKASRHHGGSPWGGFFFWLVFYLVMFAFAALAVYLARDRIAHAADFLAREPFQASMTGLLSPMLALLAFILLCITLIGIPVAAALIFLYPVFVFLGWVVVGYRVGHSVGKEGPVTIRTIFTGLLVISGLQILHVLLRLVGVGGVLDFFIKMAGFTVAFVASMMGLGAIICTRFRRAPVGPAGAAGMMPPAPPIPPGPSYPPPPSVWPPPPPPSPPADPFAGPPSGS